MKEREGNAGRWGYEAAKELPDGRVIGLFPFLFTTGLVVDIDERGNYNGGRYCYAKRHEALQALMQWDGVGDPPGPWIKHKGGPAGDRSNPLRLAGIPIVEVGGVPAVVQQVYVDGKPVGNTHE